MPNPIPTIAAPSSGEVSFAVTASYGFPQRTANATPQSTATPGAWLRTAGKIHGSRKNAAASARKITCFTRIVPMAGAASTVGFSSIFHSLSVVEKLD